MNDIDDLPPLHPAVRTLANEVRAEVPSVDWARVEAQLFDEHGAVRDVSAPRSLGKTARFIAGLAIAASFAVGLLAPSSSRPNATSAIAANAPIVAGDHVMHVGDTVIAPASGLVLQSQGRVEIHVIAGSKLRLVDDGERIRFALEEGALAASVVPVHGGEPFAIDALGRRVAVHGTKLFIAIEAGNVVVAVSEGNAVVGAAVGDGRTEGPIVPTGAIGQFAGESALVVRDPAAADRAVADAMSAVPTVATILNVEPEAPSPLVAPPAVANDDHDNAPIAPSLVAPKATSTSATIDVAPSVAVIPSATAESVIVPVAPPPAGLSTEQASPSLARIVSTIQACVPRTTTSVQFTITTTMTVSVDPSGTVVDASFDDPPLSPELRACAVAKMAAVKFPTAAAKTSLTERVVLGAK